MSGFRKFYFPYGGYVLLVLCSLFNIFAGLFGPSVYQRHLVAWVMMCMTGLIGIASQFGLQRRGTIPWTSRGSLVLLFMPISMVVMTVVAFVYM